MRHRKIRIVGAAGSGKSYVAAKVSEAYGIEAFDLDDVFWDNRAGGYGVMAPLDEQDEGLWKMTASKKQTLSSCSTHPCGGATGASSCDS